jgi:hypothetical protein
MSTKAYDEPLSVEICEGEIVLTTKDGPVGISLTPSAAAKTAEQLATVAQIALKGQASHDVTVRD